MVIASYPPTLCAGEAFDEKLKINKLGPTIPVDVLIQNKKNGTEETNMSVSNFTPNFTLVEVITVCKLL